MVDLDFYRSAIGGIESMVLYSLELPNMGSTAMPWSASVRPGKLRVLFYIKGI